MSFQSFLNTYHSPSRNLCVLRRLASGGTDCVDGISQLITYHILPSSDCGVSTARFCLKNNARRSCGSLSVALQPMLCPTGLAPFYRRPAIRAVQTAQELQIVPERCWDCPSILQNNCVPTAKDLRFEWCQSVARKMASARWDDGACLQLHCLLAGWYGFSGLSRAVVSRLRIVSSRICCTSLQGVKEAHN